MSKEKSVAAVKPLRDYLPKKDLKLFQCHVDVDLLERVKKQMEVDNLSWRELTEALQKKSLDEMGKSKSL